MRYVGQEHTLTIAAPSADGRVAADAAGLSALFEREYARTFGHSMDEEHEIVTVRALVRLPRELRRAPRAGEQRPARRRATEAWSFARDEFAPFALVARDTLRPGDTLAGPAIVTETTATTYLDAGFVAEVHPSGVADRAEAARMSARSDAGRRPGRDGDRPPGPERGGRADEARARADGVLARDLRGARLRGGALRPRHRDARRRRRACRPSWAR